MYHYTDGGLRNVWLANGYEIKTTPYGEGVVFHNRDVMGIDGQSVAPREKTGKVPRWADKLIRLLYTAQAEGHEPIAKAVERIKTVERLVKQKIVVKETRGQWRPSLHDDEAAHISAGRRRLNPQPLPVACQLQVPATDRAALGVAHADRAFPVEHARAATGVELLVVHQGFELKGEGTDRDGDFDRPAHTAAG